MTWGPFARLGLVLYCDNKVFRAPDVLDRFPTCSCRMPEADQRLVWPLLCGDMEWRLVFLLSLVSAEESKNIVTCHTFFLGIHCTELSILFQKAW